jgi:hypothetical protein
MKRISFNPHFVNAAGNDLIPGKIHSIRQNLGFWKQYEGREVTLFTWEGKPYRSKQKVFCTKRIVSVQEVELHIIKRQLDKNFTRVSLDFLLNGWSLNLETLSKNDGFYSLQEFKEWFVFGKYKPGKMAILQFTDFRYRLAGDDTDMAKN